MLDCGRVVPDREIKDAVRNAARTQWRLKGDCVQKSNAGTKIIENPLGMPAAAPVGWPDPSPAARALDSLCAARDGVVDANDLFDGHPFAPN